MTKNRHRILPLFFMFLFGMIYFYDFSGNENIAQYAHFLIWKDNELIVSNHADYPDPRTVPADFCPLLFQKIPVNRADKDVLKTIPGIGEKLASEILRIREGTLRFDRPEDLLEVRGIGERRLLVLKEHLNFE